MIAFPKKRIFSCIGEPRSGKDSVANYLIKTRGFKAFAFADQIKEEFGISKEEFEAAKVAGNIEDLRNKLWNFSSKIKERDPLHFIKNVMDKIVNTESSVIITDIRTEDEFNAFYNMNKTDSVLRRIYYIVRKEPNYGDDMLAGSKLSMQFILSEFNNRSSDEIKVIKNFANGIFYFNKQLDEIFICEDLRDIFDMDGGKNMIEDYICQYEIYQK